MSRLSEFGFEHSMTGGIVPEDLHLFENLKAKLFMAGRALASEEGRGPAQSFHREIAKHW